MKPSLDRHYGHRFRAEILRHAASPHQSLSLIKGSRLWLGVVTAPGTVLRVFEQRLR
jgi:hypothetical protein